MNATERRIHLRRAVRELDLVTDHILHPRRSCATCTALELVDPIEASVESDLRAARARVISAASRLGLRLDPVLGRSASQTPVGAR